METHHGISALVTRASIPGGTIVAIGTALIVDQKLVNLISRTWHQISMLESFYAGRVFLLNNSIVKSDFEIGKVNEKTNLITK